MSHSVVKDVFSQEDILAIKSLPQVLLAKAKLDETAGYSKQDFSVPLTDSMRSVLSSKFGLDLSGVTKIPSRWIKGDTVPHIDFGRTTFERTYLVYLTENPGNLVLDSIKYPISENTGYAFNEGIRHETVNTDLIPRLAIGPMSEQAFTVGPPPPIRIRYFLNEVDASTGNNPQAFSTSYVVGTADGGNTAFATQYTSWMISTNSTGSSTGLVLNDDSLNAAGTYLVYPAPAPCFLEGTNILCQVDGVDTYVPIEKLKQGTLVKTSKSGYKKVDLIGKGPIYNPGNDERIKNRLYKCSPQNFPGLNSNLFITGAHSILVDSLTEKHREQTIEQLGDIYVTESKYRLMACIDERAKPWNSEGTYTIYETANEQIDGILILIQHSRTLRIK
jgi:hypothetical protein